MKTREPKNTIVKVKVVGEREALESFVEEIKRLYPLILEGPVKPNDYDDGVHTFLTIDLSVRRGQERSEQA
ncbi:hypothetical protein J7L49_05175 [Candidatus Bathyarchaeota archaeon]|nr:hypothetical protein [Candidatus Bathyarchaeota archaeon]